MIPISLLFLEFIVLSAIFVATVDAEPAEDAYIAAVLNREFKLDARLVSVKNG